MYNKLKKQISKYNDLPITAKASFVYLVTSLIQKGLGFVTSPIFIRLMSSEEYGIMTLYFTNYDLIGTIAMFSLSAGCFDIGIQDFKENRYSFIFSVLILSNIITIITGLIVFILYPYIGIYLRINKFLLSLMFINYFFSPAFIFWTRAERFAFRYKSPAILTSITAVISSVLAVLMVCFSAKYKVEARIVGMTAVMLPLNCFFWIFISKKANFKPRFEYIKFAFLFNLPLIPHYLSSYVLNSSDRLMIANLCGESAAAYYSLAYTVAAVVTIVWNAINSSLVPYVFDKYERKEYNAVSAYVLPIMSIFALICLMIVMMAPEIIKILGTKEYYQAMYVIPPVVGGVYFQALYFIFTNILYFFKKPKIVMLASLTAAALNICLNYIGIMIFGYIAAGYTTLICFLLQAVFDYYISKKIVGQNIYDMKYLTTLSVVVLIISLLSNLLYKYIFFRWIIIICLIVILILKKDVMHIAKNKK